MAAQFLSWEYLLRIFGIVSLQCIIESKALCSSLEGKLHFLYIPNTHCHPTFMHVLLTAVTHHTQIYLYIRDVKNLVQALKENDFVMRWDCQRRVRSDRKLQ